MTLGDSLRDKLDRIDKVLDNPDAAYNNEDNGIEEDGSSMIDSSSIDEYDIDEEDQSSAPAYLQDRMPHNKTDIIKWSLLRGKTEEDLISEGYNPGTVRNCAHELKRDGLYKKPPKEDRPLLPAKTKKGGEVAQSPDKALKTYAKGSPAEELIQHFAKLPDEIRDGRGEVFESGMKFGLSVAVLGIRMAQELSNLGVSQVKPMIEMTKSMREGEAIAAKNAAREAAEEAAGQVGDILGPTLQDIRSSLAESSKSKVATGDPMRDMLAETMKPLLKNIMGQMAPGAAMGVDTDDVVSGWTKKKADR